MTPERIDMLKNLGFFWIAFKGQWNVCFTLLGRYRQEYGDCNVPKTYVVDGF